jgi:hypothetical protein
VEASSPPGDEVRAGELLRAAVEAAAAQNPGRALDLLRQLASLDPARAETLLSAPALESIRPGLEELLGQLTAAARLHAENRLAEATQKLAAATVTEPVKDTSAGEVRPEIFLLVAARLMEAGGLANYVRSAELSAASVDPSRWAPALQAEPPIDRPPGDWHGFLRLPILAWLALGIASVGVCWWLRYDCMPIVCGVWAAGLLVLSFARAWRYPPRS